MKTRQLPPFLFPVREGAEHYCSMALAVMVLVLIMTTSIPAQTPVSVNGPLRVSGNRIVNQNNSPVSFAGASYFWSNTGWGAERFYNSGAVNYFRNTWKAGIIRAAMGVEASGGYLSDPTGNKNRVKAVVDAAIAAGMYVIIDWHSHDAELYTSSAISFFQEMAQTYGNTPNVIYEIYNEPEAASATPWSTIKSYALQVIPAIRNIDPDNIIVVGTPNWSQFVSHAANDPITGYSNIAYTLHFYAATHKQWLRDEATYALNNGIALMVTEYGTCEATGDGVVDQTSTNEWVAFMKQNYLSNCNWSIHDKAEAASILKPGVVSSTGNWTDADLTTSGLLVKGIVLNWSPSSPPTVSLTAPADGATFTAPANITISANASDSDGTVSSVAFYQGSTLIATDNTSPYSITWQNVQPGTYSLTARATDDSGASTTSSARSITVNSSTPNIALNKVVTVSSIENSSYPGSSAVDGNMTTRWSSAFSDPQWIYVDLGTSYSISRVKINWEAAYGRDYQVQVGTSTSTWTTIKTVTGNTSLTNDHTGLSGTGRYVRIYGTARGTPYGYSIYELEIYGTASSPANLLTNAGFESGLSPWTGNSCTIAQNSTQKQSGTYSVRVTSRTAAWAGPVQNIRSALVAQGTGTYDISAWVRKESGSGTAKVTVMIRYGGTSYYHGVTGSFNSTSWSQVSGQVSLNWTGTLEDATFYVETIGETGNFFADNASLTKSGGAREAVSHETEIRRPDAHLYEFYVYPNPVEDRLSVLLTPEWNNDAVLEVVNSRGEIFTTRHLTSERTILDLSSASPSGIYLLRVSNGVRSSAKKVVKK